MSVTNQEEYQLENGQKVSIQLNGNKWEVACWNKDDSAHWYKEFDAENMARIEYNRWKPK